VSSSMIWSRVYNNTRSKSTSETKTLHTDKSNTKHILQCTRSILLCRAPSISGESVLYRCLCSLVPSITTSSYHPYIINHLVIKKARAI
jgi:hypothetical protein